jgi:hypothetical protein
VLPNDMDFGYEVEAPTVFIKNVEQVTKSLGDLTNALDIGQQMKWIDQKAAGKLFRSALEQFGVDVPEPAPVDIQTPAPGTPDALVNEGSYVDALNRVAEGRRARKS